MQPEFLEKIMEGQQDMKSSKNSSKMRFLEFRQKSQLSLFLVNVKMLMVISPFCENSIPGKNLVFKRLAPKFSQSTNRLVNSSVQNISRMV